MAGLDRMIDQILQKARDEAEAVLAEARAEAGTIKEEAENKAASETEKIRKESLAKQNDYRQRAASQSDMKRRTALLKAKQDVISDVIGKAYGVFTSKEGSEYFDILKRLIEPYIRAEAGTVSFGAADLKAMPAEFKSAISDMAKAKGGELTICDEAAPVDKGFVLAYGGIEENCSFESIFASRKEELQDLVQKALFS